MRVVCGVKFPNKGKRYDQARADTNHPSPSGAVYRGCALQLGGRSLRGKPGGALRAVSA